MIRFEPTLVSFLCTLPLAAAAQSASEFGFDFEVGQFSGDGLNNEDEASSFVLGEVFSSDVFAISGDTRVKLNGRLSQNMNIQVGDGYHDQYMSAAMADIHVFANTGGMNYGAFGGLWLGELNDGEPSVSGDLDQVFQYFIGGEFAVEGAATDTMFQIGWVDSVSDDFDNNVEFGYDYRQVREAVLGSVEATRYFGEAVAVSGRVSGLHGKMSDESVEFDDGDYSGVFLELSTEYMVPDRQMSLIGGVRLAQHQFEDPDDEVQEIQTLSLFGGLNFTFGEATNGSIKERRRTLGQFEMPWFLVNANTSSVGNLN